MAVEYIAQDPSVVGSSPSCELTVPMMRQESRNLIKVSEVVGESWEIGRELINLQEVLGEGCAWKGHEGGGVWNSQYAFQMPCRGQNAKR